MTATTTPMPARTAPVPTSSAAAVLEVVGPIRDRYDEILTPDALAFLTELHSRFSARRHDRLADRMRRRFEIGNGHDPQFRDDTAHIRHDDEWRVAGAGPGLEDRRVEITGPTDPKMTINALNSGAKVWLADQEDATSPTWKNVIEGQLSLYDAIRGQLQFTSPEGKSYEVTAEQTPTIVMRPRGWHLVEKHLRYTDRTGRTMDASGSLVDFGLYFFHNAKQLIENGVGPYFYIAKLESAEEAKLWDDVFTFSERYLGIEHGTIRATVLIETLPAAFEMEEILFEMRDHVAGLNAGRWDYIFSIIKNYRGRGARFVLPDRSEVTMTVPFMRAYTELLVKTCHKRGAFAIGGMSAFIPNRRDPEVTERAFEKVAADKKREAGDGFDGTWVAHPDLIPVARAEFDAVLGDRPNQLDRQRPDVSAHPGRRRARAALGAPRWLQQPHLRAGPRQPQLHRRHLLGRGRGERAAGPAQRCRTGRSDGQSGRPLPGKPARCLSRHPGRPADGFHRLYGQGLGHAARRAQGQSFRPDDRGADPCAARRHGHPRRP